MPGPILTSLALTVAWPLAEDPVLVGVTLLPPFGSDRARIVELPAASDPVLAVTRLHYPVPRFHLPSTLAMPAAAPLERLAATPLVDAIAAERWPSPWPEAGARIVTPGPRVERLVAGDRRGRTGGKVAAGVMVRVVPGDEPQIGLTGPVGRALEQLVVEEGDESD